MEENREQQRPFSVAKFILIVIAYVACVAAITVGLAVVFPKHALLVVTVMYYILFAIPSFVAGWQYDDPRSPEEGRRQVRSFAIVMVAVSLGPLISNLIRYGDRSAIIFALGYVGLMLAAMYPPFFLGRAIARRLNR